MVARELMQDSIGKKLKHPNTNRHEVTNSLHHSDVAWE